MVGFANLKSELDELGVKVFAASVDSEEKSKPVAQELNFPLGHSITRAQADTLGSWWEERRQIVQPSEFILNAEAKVIASSYSDGPLGRIEAADVIRLVKFYEARKT